MECLIGFAALLFVGACWVLVRWLKAGNRPEPRIFPEPQVSPESHIEPFSVGSIEQLDFVKEALRRLNAAPVEVVKKTEDGFVTGMTFKIFPELKGYRLNRLVNNALICTSYFLGEGPDHHAEEVIVLNLEDSFFMYLMFDHRELVTVRSYNNSRMINEDELAPFQQMADEICRVYM